MNCPDNRIFIQFPFFSEADNPRTFSTKFMYYSIRILIVITYRDCYFSELDVLLLCQQRHAPFVGEFERL